MHCVIFGARPVTSALQPYYQAAHYTIAADAGYQSMRALGLTPDYLLGDYDSAPPPEPAPNVERLPREKDDTDMHYAAKHALAMGAKQVTILGGTGGRLDHTLANLQTLVFLAEHGVRACLADECHEIYALGPGVHEFSRCKQYVSVLCAGKRAAGITLRGLRYPLTDAVLTHDFPIGVSNEFTGEEMQIAVGDGMVYLIFAQEQ